MRMLGRSRPCPPRVSCDTMPPSRHRRTRGSRVSGLRTGRSLGVDSGRFLGVSSGRFPSILSVLLVCLVAIALIGLGGCGSTGQESPVVVLFSDAGNGDYRVAQLMGYIYSGYPAARVAAGATDMPSFDLVASAYVLDLSSLKFPAGTVFLGHVIPGSPLGVSCLAAVDKTGRVFVAPDNGLLTLVARDPGLQATCRIENQALFDKPLKTSTAAYILGTAAALIASGRAPKDLGPPAGRITLLDIPAASCQGDALTGTVVFVDHFGNCVTNIPDALVTATGLQPGDAATASWPGGHVALKVATAYGDVPEGKPLALLREASPLVLAVNMGSFSQTYGVKTGTVVTVTGSGAAGQGVTGTSGQTGAAVPTKPSATPVVLTRAQDVVQTALDRLDTDLAAAAAKLTTTGLTGAGARAVLRDLVARHPDAIDFTTVGATGRLVVVEPAAYRSAEGADVSTQEDLIRLHATLRPVLSRTFAAAEDIQAVALEYPVMSSSGALLGSVSALFKPDQFLGALIEPLATGNRVDKVWAMDTDGLILYDPDAAQVGTNLFLDPLHQPYAQLLTLGRCIAAKPSGAGSYTFLAKGSTTAIVKDATWVSVGLHGTQWRLVAALVSKGTGAVGQ